MDLKLLPDEPGTIAVVIFPDNIFKYASSVLRHFPDLRPAEKDDSASAAPSKNDLLMTEMVENLKNPHDSIRAKDLSQKLEEADKPLVVDVQLHLSVEHVMPDARIVTLYVSAKDEFAVRQLV